MTNEQLRVLLELIKGRIELEVEIIGTELAEHGAERYSHWYNKETGRRLFFTFGKQPDSEKHEQRPSGEIKVLTGIKGLVSELERYSKSLERSRNEKW